MTAFDQAFDILIGHEGGYTSGEGDPGGETKYGISKRAYPDVDIANLTEDDAKKLYKSDYWDKLYLDTAAPPLALIVFDAAVNNGVGQATKFLQTGLGVTADGVFGSQSQAALAAVTGDKVSSCIADTHGARIFMMAGLSTWEKFGKGWSKRLAQLPYQAAGMTSNGASGGGNGSQTQAQS